ncbi:epsin-2-like isoform X4 [Eriocheir sinensis]|uniref:epsin-2-like isoform X4 n=1 Tax=Eriocheir sinensis TaxID=95602 RepID=UPI0021CA9D01|nr:epsin-2-like isoform X4 [Eriocheir sinensis]
MALQMNVSGIRRNLKNIAHNYTDAQIKVREATSNDPWGPSSTLMSEVADLTYNVVAFTEIMQMIWKRLNDHGRNWRHVYKALVLLEYLIKTGSEKVADQCKENIFAIETLKDFQYIEENKDQGMNVREKARALVTLLKDEERLRNERVRALKAKERFAQSVSGIGSDSRQDRHQAEELTIMCDGDKDISSPTSPTYHDTYVTSTNRPSERNSFGIKDGPSGLEPQLEAARPQTVGEEELQLQLALAMSKEEAEQEEQKKRSDDVRLQMAITQSEEDFKECRRTQTEDESAMNDLLDINFNPHSGINGGGARPASTPPTSTSASALDPWGMPATASNTASAASASPLHTAPVKSLPGVDFSSSPPPVPPLPSFPMTFSDDAKVTLRHSNPPLLNSSPLLYATHRHNRSGTPSPNPFHDSPSLPRPTSLLITSSSSSTTSASVTPYRHSLFPPSSSSYASMLETPLSTRISTSSTFSTSSYTTTLLGKSCSDPPANVWGLAQTDPWGMALPNGGSETPNQPDPWGSPVSGPPSRMTSPPTTSDPWAPARSPEPPMGGICGNDPWAVLGSVPPAKDPWEPVESKPAPTRDPFSPLTPTDNRDLDEFSALSTREKPTRNGASDVFSMSGLTTSLTDMSPKAPPQKSKSPAAFLGENSNLVNLDNLVSAKQLPAGLGTTTTITSSPLTSSNSSFINNLNNNNNNNNLNLTTTTTTTNPFASASLPPSSFTGVNPFSSPSPPNPFQAQQAPKPSMNQLRTTGIGGMGLPAQPPSGTAAPGPWGPTPPPAAQSVDENPFLL